MGWRFFSVFRDDHSLNARHMPINVKARTLRCTPHLPCRFDDQSELGRLRLACDLVAVDRTREAALRLQADLLPRNDPSGVVDAAPHSPLRFELPHLARHP